MRHNGGSTAEQPGGLQGTPKNNYLPHISQCCTYIQTCVIPDDRTPRPDQHTCHGFSGSRRGPLFCAACPPLLLLLLLLLLDSLGRFTPLPVSLIRIPRGPPHSAASGAGAGSPAAAAAASLASLSSRSCLGSLPHFLVSDTRVMSTVRHSYLSSGHASATPGRRARGSR